MFSLRAEPLRYGLGARANNFLLERLCGASSKSWLVGAVVMIWGAKRHVVRYTTVLLCGIHTYVRRLSWQSGPPF